MAIDCIYLSYPSYSAVLCMLEREWRVHQDLRAGSTFLLATMEAWLASKLCTIHTLLQDFVEADPGTKSRAAVLLETKFV